MAGALYFGAEWLAPELASSAPLVTKGVTLMLLLGAGGFIYFVLAFAIGGADLGMLRRSLARGGKAGTGKK
jgi:putative peptidoglycan lipid II flippase